jgi:hypothetical protein
VNPCASMIASMQPSGDAASNSSARRRSRRPPRCCHGFHDAADHNAVGQSIEVIVAPVAEGGKPCAFECISWVA